MQRRRRLHLVYRAGGDGAETVRDVDVHGYGLRRGDWFFVGHCHLRDEARLFYLGRVVDLRDRPDRAAHACRVARDAKGGDYRIPAGFDLDAWRLQQPWDYREHPPVEATVRSAARSPAPPPASCPGARLAPAGADGARDATLQVRSLDGLARQVMAWGADAELVAPAEGRARVLALLDGLGGRAPQGGGAVTPYAFEKRVRRLLLLIPAARAAGGAGLPLSRALALTGARSVEELQGDVLAVDDVQVGTDDDADHLLMAIEGGRVRVDVDMGFGRPPPLSLQEGAALLAALRPFAKGGGRTVERALREDRAGGAGPPPRRGGAGGAGHRPRRSGRPASGPPALEAAIDARREVTIEYRAESDGSLGAAAPRAAGPLPAGRRVVPGGLERGQGGGAPLPARPDLRGGDRAPAPSAPTAARGWSGWRGAGSTSQSGAERRVVLRFAPAAAAAARERYGPAASPRRDGSLRVALEAAPNDHLLGQVMAWGGGATIEAPADLREALLRRVEAARARHLGAAAPDGPAAG